MLGDVLLPVRGIIQRCDSRVGPKDGAVRVLVAPECKCEFVRRDQREVAAAKMTEDAFAGALLPDAGSFGVAQKCVAVVDPCKMEIQRATVEKTAPDKARMAERAVGDGNRLSADDVVNDVVISEISDWVGARLAVDVDGEQHVARIHRCFRHRCERRQRVRVEHPFEDVDVRRNEAESRDDDGCDKTCVDQRGVCAPTLKPQEA